MYCPNPECPRGEAAEHESGVTHCDHCGSALAEAKPANEKLVSVFEVPNAGLVPFVESLLESADIPFLIQGIGSSLDFVSGPVNVWVEEDRAEEARALLRGVRPAEGPLT